MFEATREQLKAYAEWACGDDAGSSSRAMMSAIIGVNLCGVWGKTSYPGDSDDFGRCYRMLKRFPELKEHIGALSSVSPSWAGLIAVWSYLEELFDAKKYNELYREMAIAYGHPLKENQKSRVSVSFDGKKTYL